MHIYVHAHVQCTRTLTCQMHGITHFTCTQRAKRCAHRPKCVQSACLTHVHEDPNACAQTTQWILRPVTYVLVHNMRMCVCRRVVLSCHYSLLPLPVALEPHAFCTQSVCIHTWRVQRPKTLVCTKTRTRAKCVCMKTQTRALRMSNMCT